MSPQEFAFAAPTTEEITRVAAVTVGAGATAAVEGVIVSMAPKLGALELPFTWGTLLGVPAVGIAAALMTKGILGDLGMGIAAGGAAVLGYTLPAMLQEFTLARGRGSGQGPGGPGVKLLGQGAAAAAQRQQQAAARSLGWVPEAIR